jgi:hypothetical protein
MAVISAAVAVTSAARAGEESGRDGGAPGGQGEALSGRLRGAAPDRLHPGRVRRPGRAPVSRRARLPEPVAG